MPFGAATFMERAECGTMAVEGRVISLFPSSFCFLFSSNLHLFLLSSCCTFLQDLHPAQALFPAFSYQTTAYLQNDTQSHHLGRSIHTSPTIIMTNTSPSLLHTLCSVRLFSPESCYLQPWRQERSCEMEQVT